MAIVFMSKTAKKRSLLLDALRILAWEEYKSTNKESLKDLQYGGYAVFDAEWKDEKLHDMTYEELIAFAKSLEFTEVELLSIRSTYYAKKNNSSGATTSATSTATASATPTRKVNDSSANSNVSVPVPDEEFDVGELF
ncbi:MULTISPECIES: hypothetical protein [unclassified Microcoleus]|uniref:hypothetical protein n=1 Tax=unclassified Microcoleus TaxID=2642155 RepID=UPI002FD22423